VIIQTVSFDPTPEFKVGAEVFVFDMTLTGDVTSSTLSGVQGIVIFVLRQDATGSRTFAWPANVLGSPVIGSEANSITTLAFTFDGNNAVPVGIPGIYL
jgi:hypothetical protein